MKIESAFLLFIILSNIITYVLVSEVGFYSSAVLYHNVSYPEYLLRNLTLLIIAYFALLFFIKTLPSNKPTKHFSAQRHNSIDFTFSLIIAYSWLVYIFMGIGRAGSTTYSIGFLANIFPITPLILLYFAARNSNHNKHYYSNLTLGVLLPIIQGWSGILISICVVYIFEKVRRINTKNVLKLLMITASVFIIFNYLYQLKFFIRSGEAVEVDYILTTEYAISRVTAFQNFDYFTSISEQMALHYNGNPLFYIQEFVLALIPKAALGLSDYRPIDNIFTVNFLAEGNPDFNDSGFAITMPGLYALAIKVSIINALIFPIFLLTSIFIMLRLSYSIWSERIKYYIIYILYSLVYSGNMRELAIQIYVLIIFVAISRISIYKKSRCNTFLPFSRL